MKRFTIVTAFAAIVLTGCGLVPVDRLPAGSSGPIPPDRIVVFGKVMSLDEGETKPSWSATFGLLTLEFLPAHLAKEVETTYRWSRKISPDQRRFQFREHNGDDFYITLPRHDYLLVGFANQHPYECLNFGFRAPADATVLYLGAIVFKTASWTITAEDSYDLAVRRLRERNPGLKGPIAKALLGHLPVTRQPDVKCHSTFNPYGIPFPSPLI